MSLDPAAGLEELTIALGDLQITIRRRLGATGRAASPGEDEFEVAYDAGSLPAEPDRPQLTVTQASPAPAEPDLDARLLQATTAAEFGTFDIAALRPLARRLRSSNVEWSARARLVRAYRGGIAARNRLEGHGGLRAPASPEIPYGVIYYLVMRGLWGAAAFWTHDSLSFFEQVCDLQGGGIAYGVVCQGLPSQAEADAFLLGAGQPWPAALE